VEMGVVVLVLGEGRAVSGVVGAVPVGLPRLGGFLEDLGTLGAEDVVAEAEVFMEDHGLLGDPLVAVSAAYVAGIGRSRAV